MKAMNSIRALFVLGILAVSSAHGAGQSTVTWQTWSDSLFATAAAESRFVLLNLEAVWCHWCHVMDAKTYSDPSVGELIEIFLEML